MNSFLNKIYLYRFLDAFKLIGVIFALFFSQSGLTPFQISILLSVWSVTTILTEVPMGVLADKYSRRNLLILGLILLCLGLLFWLKGGFINYAIGFIFWGLKNTLTSGTLEAFIYDELSAIGKSDEYEKVSGKMSSFFSIGLLLSAVFGGIVAEFSYPWTIIASIITTILSACVLLTITEVKSIKSTNETKYFQIVKQAFLQIKNNWVLLSLILFICIVFSSFAASDEYWTLVYENLGLKTRAIGFFVAIVYGLSSISGFTVHYFKSTSKFMPYLLALAAGILFIAFGITKSLIMLPLSFIAIYLYQVASIKLEAQMQSQILSSERATVSSMKSLFFEIIYMLFVLVFGFIGTKFGIMSIVIASGAVVVAVILIFIVINKSVIKIV